MESPEHVVVVGAGMVGLSAAWFLQAEGVRVTVVDRAGVAAGSSWGNAGWLAPALTLPLPDPAILAGGIKATLKPSSPVYVPVSTNPRLLKFLVDFARHCTTPRWRAAMTVFAEANRQAFDAFDEIAAGGLAEPTKAAEPFLAAFASEEDRQTLLDEFDHVRELGVETPAELLDREAMHALVPALGDAVTCGVRLRDQRFINPGRYVNALADAVRQRGAEIRTDVDVRDVRESPSGVRLEVAGGEPLTADAVVIATGTWLGSLARDVGVRTIVQAGRGYSFTVQPEQMPVAPMYFPAQRVACTPLGDGLRVAGMMEFRKPGAPLDPRRVKAIIDAASPMLTGVDWAARTDEWVGSRPCTADGLPLIGRTKSSRVFVSGGHGMWGIALGPLSGKLLAAQMVRGETSSLLSSFDPLR
ncbi:amino acid dehydrogenase [Aeromicrobium sp. Root344]|uniref:NAD(P)/FAD-dependent oxidoreductase n=1 Tax=Aeromicrobium sp. Root344 TaxID=1736521 RepID=UPI0006FC15B0|nr:FAD-dependent oxidoreductase [Aeromicrobium sp. Root344]KQV74650.1 amino acid dehydrogenase [Aeromicrobium sp. Root344]